MGSTGAPYTSDRWWSADTVAVVTGSNKGIGQEIARALAQQGLTTVVTARNEEQGKAAAADIQQSAPASRVLFHQLDISDPTSVAAFGAWLEDVCGERGLGVLVNNAGFAYKGNTFGADEAQTTLGINYYGTKALTERLLPLLKAAPNARVVNVSSRAGLRSIIPSPDLLRRLTSAGSAKELDAAAAEFVGSIRDGTHRDKGWPDSMYGVSKLLLSLWSEKLARQLEDNRIMVNAMCPGWCRTAMSSQRGNKSAAEGADTAVWLALRSPREFESGGFWGERQRLGW